MPRVFDPHCLLCLLSVLSWSVLSSSAADPKQIDFNHDIRPILSNTCYKCHGPDEKERQVGLRLDTQDGMTAKLVRKFGLQRTIGGLRLRFAALRRQLHQIAASTGRRHGSHSLPCRLLRRLRGRLRLWRGWLRHRLGRGWRRRGGDTVARRGRSLGVALRIERKGPGIARGRRRFCSRRATRRS